VAKVSGDKKQTRASPLTVERRVHMVLVMMYEGWDSSAIVPRISELWDIGERQARNYIKKALARKQELSKEIEASALADAIGARRALRRASQDEAFKLEVLQDEARLLGLYDREGAGQVAGVLIRMDV